jgi:hypothetical protein
MLLGSISLPLTLFVPWIGIFTGLAAVIIGFRTRRAAKRAGIPAPGAMPGVVTGAIGLVVSVLVMVVGVVFWNELQQFTECKAAANTIAEQQRCSDQFARRIEKKLHLPPGTYKGSQFNF